MSVEIAHLFTIQLLQKLLYRYSDLRQQCNICDTMTLVFFQVFIGF